MLRLHFHKTLATNPC